MDDKQAPLHPSLDDFPGAFRNCMEIPDTPTARAHLSLIRRLIRESTNEALGRACGHGGAWHNKWANGTGAMHLPEQLAWYDATGARLILPDETVSADIERLHELSIELVGPLSDVAARNIPDVVRLAGHEYRALLSLAQRCIGFMQEAQR